MKLSNLIFNTFICSTLLIGCSHAPDYPKLRDVRTDVKPTLSFADANKELKELEQERNALKAKH